LTRRRARWRRRGRDAKIARSMNTFTLSPVRSIVARRLPHSGPAALARVFSELPHPFVLRSSGGDRRSRWSFFGADPFAVFRDPAELIAAWRATRASEGAAGVELAGWEGGAPPPFAGGAVGYWAYDFGRRLERIPARARDDLRLPDLVVGLHDLVVAFDHASGAAWALASGLPADKGERRARAERRIEEMLRRLEASRPVEPAAVPASAERLVATSTFERAGYLAAVESVQEHIRRGDIFQANLSRRWTVPLAATSPAERSFALFEALGRSSPAPFACWLAHGDHAIACASPERFLELRGARVETRPIKGTRPRGGDRAADARLAAELLASAKDRAENVMIVDVLRNDLGRVCEAGSVETPVLCELESFPQVHHLTSTVAGVLREGLDAFDLLHACFPGGSITGAPKIRAIQILDALEPARRHAYTGCAGYVDWSGDADWNILIRGAIVTREAVHFAAGGGITSDSDPEAEHAETLHKAEAVRGALAELGVNAALERSG
jgi:para-aminobenzoate synthetase component 1